jgi:hypothetical protein
VIIDGLPVGGNGVAVGLITRPPLVCVCTGDGVAVGVTVLNGTTVGVAVIVGVGVEVGITFGDGVGVGVSVGDNLTLGVGVTEGAGGLVCCPAA